MIWKAFAVGMFDIVKILKEVCLLFFELFLHLSADCFDTDTPSRAENLVMKLATVVK